MKKRKFFPLMKLSKASSDDASREEQQQQQYPPTDSVGAPPMEGNKKVGNHYPSNNEVSKNSRKKNDLPGLSSLMSLSDQLREQKQSPDDPIKGLLSKSKPLKLVQKQNPNIQKILEESDYEFQPKPSPRNKQHSPSSISPQHQTPKKNESKSLSGLKHLYTESPLIRFESRSNNNEIQPVVDKSANHHVNETTNGPRISPVTIPKLDLTNPLHVSNQQLQNISPRASSSGTSPRYSPRSNVNAQSRPNVSPLVPPLKILPQPADLSLPRPRTSSPRSGRSSDRKSIVEKIIRQNTLFDQNNTESYEWNSFCFNITSHKSNLKELRLKKCGLKDFEHATPLFKCLAANQVKLKILDLEDNFITKASMSQLSEYLLVACESLQVLNLRKNQISDDGIACIASTFKDQDTVLYLEEMDLSSNYISDEGLTYFTNFSKHYAPYLATFKCFDNSITNINILRSLINDENKNYLRNIDLWKNNVQLEGLARFTTIATKITSLNLGCNSLGDKGVIVISKYLSFCKSLKW